MPFAQVRDLRLYYELRGEGPRLLLISGSGGDLRRKPNIFAGPLGEAFTLLAYDQRGLGQTERPDSPYSMAAYAEDANALLDVVGWERCLVMGISFGGMVAQEFAIRFPQRVERLVLACTSSGGAGAASYPLHELAGLTTAERLTRTFALSDTRRDAAWQTAHPEQYDELVRQAIEAAAVGANEPQREMGARRQLEARRHHDTYDRLPAIQTPAYICGGQYDGIAPVANQEALARQIPGSQLELFEGGHLFLVQDGRAYQRVIAFLNRTSDGAG